MGVYIVYQKEGKKADRAGILFEAIKSGDAIQANRIYSAEFGNSQYRPEFSRDSAWWKYNATANIKQNHEITIEDVYRRAGYKVPFNKRYAEIVCQIATEKHGGIWDWYWEY